MRRPLGFSELNVAFTNAGDRTIEGLVVNLELLDGSGQRIMTVPANFTIKSGANHEPWPFRLSGMQENIVKTAVPPGAKALLLGYNPRSTASCPADVVLSYAKIFYTDGTNFEAHLQDWYADSVPYKIPEAPISAIGTLVFQGWVKATVSLDGRLKLDPLDELTPEEGSYLQKTADSWLLLPAVHSGFPMQSVVLMFVSHGACTDVAALPHHEPEGPWISVNICPRNDPSVEEVYVGGFFH